VKKKYALMISSVLLIALMLNFGSINQTVKGRSQTGYSDDFSTNSGLWQYLGAAYRDQTTQSLFLTSDSYSQGGAIFFNNPVQSSFTANFRYKVSGGDGLTMFFYKQKYTTIGSGGSLGFTPDYAVVPGYGIEFDAWQNIPEDFQQTTGYQATPPSDPSDNHIALVKDWVGDHLTYVNDDRVKDNIWHQVSVVVQSSSVKVSVDNGVVLQWTGTLSMAYDGFGFSGGNGGAAGFHIIDDFSINFDSVNVQKPLLTTLVDGSFSQSSFREIISGNLTFNGGSIAEVPIYLSYSVNGGESWQDLTMVNTNSEGNYSALWFLNVTGTYQLKAVFKGSSATNNLGASNIITFTLEPSGQQSTLPTDTPNSITEPPEKITPQKYSFLVAVLIVVIVISVLGPLIFIISKSIKNDKKTGAPKPNKENSLLKHYPTRAYAIC
jgi:hypothetical protein